MKLQDSSTWANKYGNAFGESIAQRFIFPFKFVPKINFSSSSLTVKFVITYFLKNCSTVGFGNLIIFLPPLNLLYSYINCSLKTNRFYNYFCKLTVTDVPLSFSLSTIIVPS